MPMRNENQLLPYLRHKVGGTMKHEKEWYTCDRCGKEIDRLPQDGKLFARMRMNPEEFKVICEETEGYITDKHELIKGVLSVEIKGRIRRREKTIHLCSNCRKDFDRFMNNEQLLFNNLQIQQRQ